MINNFLNRPIPKSFRNSRAGWDKFLRNLQANIVKHYNRPYARFVFIRFESSDQLDAIKLWIADFAVHITTAHMQLTLPQKKKHRWMLRSCLISREGLAFLKIQHPDIRFSTTGYSEIHEISGDKDHTEPFFKLDSHLLILLAHNSENALRSFAKKNIFDSLRNRGIHFSCYLEEGASKKNSYGKAIEAFGFRDGLSQPEVLKDKIEAYKTKEWDPAATLSLAFFCMKTNGVQDYGSFAVYLKIEQYKEIFNQNIDQIAGCMNDNLNFDEKKELAAAYIMGRFKDGTPVINSNKKGIPDLNNFNFNENSARNKCPFFAHIFKANPRSNNPDNRNTRIFRRGIPFQTGDGLHFFSYQANIDSQFLTIYRDWMGHPIHPGKSGVFGTDLIMMNDKDEEEDVHLKPFPKIWNQGNPKVYNDYFHASNLNLQKPTTVRGGIFYFVPSLYFLKNIQIL